MRPVRVTADRLVDGRGGVVERGALLIDGEHIVAVGRDADVPRPEGVVHVAAAGHTVLPGLLDFHVHLAYSGRPDGRAFRAETVDSSYPALALRVAAHAVGGDGVRAAVAAGIDSIEHGPWIDDATLDAMAAAGTASVPTLTVNERNFELGRETLGSSDLGWAWLSWSRDAKWATLERARAAGLRLIAGSDSGYYLPHGEHHARELTFLVQGGCTPLEAITAATAAPAAWLGWDDLGTLEPGKRATFVLVAGDPTADARLLEDPRRIDVVQDGRRVASGGSLAEAPWA